MADTPVQESLLNRIPQDLREQINAAPRDIHEKVHQRELLMIEQIRHFTNIRIDELANFGRNLLEQRKFEIAQASSVSSADKPALKSIVKRVPNKIEKRVSFSELPPEVEEFYKNIDEEASESESEDSEVCEIYTPEVFMAGDMVRDKSRDQAEQLGSPVEISPPESEDEAEEQVGQEQAEQGASDGTHQASQESPPDLVESGHESQLGSALSSSLSLNELAQQHQPLTLRTEHREPTISFDDAYGSTSPNSPEDPVIPDLPAHTPSPPQKPNGYVGSAPINIGFEALKDKYEANGAGSGQSPGSDLATPLNPENMSFSQRMAWEDRPQH